MNYWICFPQCHKCESERLNIILWFTVVFCYENGQDLSHSRLHDLNTSLCNLRTNLKGTTFCPRPSPPPNLTTFIKFSFACSPDHNFNKLRHPEAEKSRVFLPKVKCGWDAGRWIHGWPKVRADWRGLGLGETVLEEWAKQKHGKRAHAISVHWPLLTVFLCKLFCILKEFFTVFWIFLCKVGPQRVFWLGVVDKGDERLDYWLKRAKNIYI